MKKLLGELEEKIMLVLWECDCSMKPSEVQKQLKDDYAYTTIMTVMTRLAEKGILDRKQKGKAYYYKPVNTKDNFVKPRLKNIFSNILNSYGDLAISQFIDSLEDSKPEDLAKLKKYLNED